MTIFRYIYLCIALNFLLSIELNEAIKPAVVEDEKNVDFKMDEDSNYPTITIDENVPDALLFYIEDFKGPLKVRDKLKCSAFSYQFVEHNGKQAFKLTSALDYESQDCQIISNAIEDDQASQFVFDLVINNLDDNPPQLSIDNSCNFKENTDYDAGNTSCKIKMTDRDGMMGITEFSITPDDEIFEVSFLDKPTDDMKEAEVEIFLAPGKQLDFETTNQYFFTVEANETSTYGSVQVTVLVTDMPDTNPIFKNIFPPQSFEENVDQTFSVKAIDGDIGVNDAIQYDIKDITCDNEDKQCACKITIGVDDGVISVTNVDREVDGNTITFIITARELHDASASTDTDKLYFFIQDQDDNSPEIIIEQLKYKKDENYAGLITNFQVKDMDLEKFGTYTVDMDCSEYEVNYCEAFQIIPNQGFQLADFSLRVKDATKLDYDNEEQDWTTITLDIVATEIANSFHNDRSTITISLTDLNDEPPIFDNEEDTTSVYENITKGETVFNASATDRDAGTVITYFIVGIWSEKLDIADTGEITTAEDDVFDYEQLQQVLIQIAASDNDNIHTTYKTLTINVMDIDDEPPSIKLEFEDGKERLQIKENRLSGEEMPVQIIATDPDTKPKLEMKIDWSSSYVTKNSDVQNLDDKDWKCFDLVVNEHEELSRNITGVLTIREECSGTFPDFEKFHSIVIFLEVTDENTEKRSDSSKTSLEIAIVDVNDNPPIFDMRTFEGLVITDTTKGPLKVGNIIANDADISDEVTYSIDPLDDWVEIDEHTGDLTIKQGVIINDDDPVKYSMTLKITASDGLHKPTQELTIQINDVNNQKPSIDGETDASSITIPEEVTEYNVLALHATDIDRDVPFHTVVFQFDAGISGPASNCFDISKDGNIIVSLKNGARLDRDKGQKSYTLPIKIYDNPDDVPQNSNSYTLTVTLLDVNDNEPFILTKTLECSESLKKGDVISNIIGEDYDEGKNAEINFNLIEVKKKSNGDKQLTIEDLKISSDDYKTATLEFLRDLSGYYGEYDVIVKTTDNGSPDALSKLNTLNLIVSKFNFHAPAFVFPSAPSEVFTLSEVQSINLGEPLKLYNQENLQDLEVNDFQNQKWDITFELTKQDGTTSDLFSVTKFGIYKARLQVTRLPNEDDMKTTHTITIEASVKKSKLDNEEAISVSTDIKIKFFSSKEEPEFDKTTDTVSFDEDAPAEHPSPDPPQAIRTAKFPSGVDLPVYYKLLDNTDYFDVNENTGELSVKKELHYNDHPYFDIKIAAFKNPNSITTPSEKSTLNLRVEVIPLNVHKPVFHPSKFNGALLNSNKEGTTIVTVTASDEDARDSGKLTFSIGEITCQKSVKAPEDPFAIDKTSGTITSTFRVTSDMSGYCKMNVYVADNADKYQIHHIVKTTAQINIISTDELVRFTFLNEDSFISENQEKITADIDVIFEKYKYKSNLADLKYDKEWRNTTADFYFLDTSENPVMAKEILGNLTDFDTFLTLKKSLANTGVNLGNFPAEYPVNVEDYFKIWLIASTIVLATLLMLVSIAFFFRNRALTQRISKLSTTKFGSQDSGLNRAGLAAPTTNKNAVEGSNPVFSNQMVWDRKNKDDLEIDRKSIISSDSDLFGVENNPEFDI